MLLNHSVEWLKIPMSGASPQYGWGECICCSGAQAPCEDMLGAELPSHSQAGMSSLLGTRSELETIAGGSA